MTMFDGDFTRRRMIAVGGGVAAAGLLVQGAAALGQSTGPAATGKPMPDGVDLPANPPATVQPGSVGFAIIGLGDYALKQIMPRFAQSGRAHIAAIVSGNPAKLKQVGDAYGVPESARYSYDSFAQIATNPAVEAVYIILPTGLHAEWAERAFAAGKHVLCEKPMALSGAECERMIAASQRANRKLMIAYRCHFEPYNMAAMALMEDDAVGALRLIRTEHSYRMGPTTPSENWRVSRALAGGGPLEDYGIYGLQAALYLSGEMPESISAATYRPANDPRFAEIFAHVSAQLRFPSGATAHVVTSYDSAGLNMVEARGTEGVLKMQPATNYGGNTLTLEAGRNRQELTPGDSEVQFARQLDHLASAIRDNTPIITPGEMGLRDLRLIEAIYASAASGQTVRLNPDATMRR
ncbi:Gfo/Idh/MocA family protein [Porphyrobacter sp. AAP60]|uniref:Gfo/Idh/MocA family protein n=1 Tax=Porphyrobacter sp. AAP60 TaxID=1523423 RepID=UPI0006CD69B8|nr:Gfo/Idh/MocA family oxidoreductase [Porphyrobacter sp. AAP60]KPF63198.1 glucose-fructose oxidoreductase [Porphyrobacter sp. AAP60]